MKLSRVGRSGMRLTPKTSLAPLNDIDSIQNSGATAMKARIRPARWRMIRAGLSAARSIWRSTAAVSLIGEAPAARQHEHQYGDQHQDDHEDGSHGRGIAIFVEQERLLVDVEDRQRRRIGGSAAGHDTRSKVCEPQTAVTVETSKTKKLVGRSSGNVMR